ncbi:related to TRM11 - Catalytic subunit of an adoMet-dependent tRNA methyltransferase complex [Melanopsichium pennsylvanicum]|uniref:tRNA (guanine(10)-N(2))-methyltransferase n=2 Tax=Melanopsichium pennsylvanicum TaxID=63383 RepID=A0AAJ4XMW2_9BASI|nr:related to TRM11-Catalytic subunit of an adoMet-dependent tRNA methyltransferase complex [Melanopsichium pennsylvanicum 4]SNX85505.1 related to TRM11 - Catalytic subunit of an adoMet-dependent tRNA methyltransferase complex [Melanopsichium pennsylvanicum]
MATSFPAMEDPASIGPLYVLHFATSNHAFRLPDFLAAAEYLRIPFAFVPTPAKPILEESRKAYDATHEASSSGYRPDLRRPFALAHLPNDEAAVNLLRRCVSLRSVWAHWSHGSSYSELHARNRQEASRALWIPYVQEAACPSWKAYVFSYSYTISDKRKIDIIQSFSYMGLKGRIQLNAPHMRWGVMEEYVAQELWPSHLRDEHNNFPAGKEGDKVELREELGDKDPRLVQIFLGRRIDVNAGPLYSEKAAPAAPRKSSDPTQEGQAGLARDLIEKLNLKKRVYIGNTSMESEMSLLMASMALAGPGKLIYDPFAGTGSMLYASAVFGAMAFGSDIDGRPMRGKENISDSNSRTGIVKSASQYGVRDHILDTVVFDMTQNPWRKDLLFPVDVDNKQTEQISKRSKGVVDGIVADPPYGVRAGAKRLGKRDPEKQRTEPYWMPDGLGPGQGCWSHERSDYIPPTRPYHLEDLVSDLLDYAYSLLCDGGRLVFWLPSMIEPEEGEENEGKADYTKSSAAIERSVSIDLPQHRRKPGQGRMRMIHFSLQDFGRWGRWLITMEKVSPENDVDDEGLRELEQRMGELGKNKDERGIYRADRDPLEFRNRYYLPREQRPPQ